MILPDLQFGDIGGGAIDPGPLPPNFLQACRAGEMMMMRTRNHLDFFDMKTGKLPNRATRRTGLGQT